MDHLNNHLPPPLPCRSLFARIGFSPLLPPFASSLQCLVDSNHQVVCNQPDVVERHLLDPDPVSNAMIKVMIDTGVKEEVQFLPIERRSPHE